MICGMKFAHIFRLERTRRLFRVLLVFALIVSANGRATVLNFNPDWKFIKADPANAAAPNFDDTSWAKVSLPHTYNDSDTFAHWSMPGHRGEQGQWGGRTWYRKEFTLPAEVHGKKVYLEIEAARQVAEFYLNGQLLGTSKNGFIPFGFDLTPFLNLGGTNVLAVMCDNRFMKDPPADEDGGGPSLGEISSRVNAGIPSSIEELRADQIPWNNPHWHPAHGGLYRNAYLHVTDRLHISLPLFDFLRTAGPYVYASDVSAEQAILQVEVPIENGRTKTENVTLAINVLDAADQVVATLKTNAMVEPGSKQFSLSGAITRPERWSPETPYLYRVRISVFAEGQEVDTSDVPFGFRTAKWDVKTGFSLNGRHIKLHGWGQKPTDEWPGLGAAQPDWLHYYTLNLMKEAGGNWVRWGHCAGAPAMLTAGDRLGIMAEQPGVDGESDTVGAAWQLRTEAFRDMLIYFRNHPSIMIWEGGNQKVTRAHAAELKALIEKYDPRGGRAFAFRRADATDGKFMDVDIGTEGGRQVPSLPVVEGEYDREESPRRAWDGASPPNFGYPEARGQTYQLTSEQYAVNQVSQYVSKLGAPEHCGGANWIFSDSTSGGRVSCEVARCGGEVDGVRLPKEAYYVCQTLFSSTPQIHIIGHWSYPAGTRKTVFVSANCPEVELFENGRSLGHGMVSNQFLFVFPDVVYQPGELKAVGYAGGKPVASASLHTAGAAAALRMNIRTGPTGFLADGADVALIDVEAVDARGNRCPTFQENVQFGLKGPGIWRGGYNSGRTNSIANCSLDLECGLNRVAVRSTRVPGAITVTAQAPNLPMASVTLESVAFPVEHGCSTFLPPLPGAVDCAPAALAMVEAVNPLAPPGVGSQRGRFLQAFSYSGPAAISGVQQGARAGAKVYTDSDAVFGAMPEALRGSDWIQAADADKFYSAVDLMDFAAGADDMVYVAFDNGLPAPSWLRQQFKATSLSVQIGGRAMQVFQHFLRKGETLTLGSNLEVRRAGACNMYVVFVKRAEQS